MLVCPIFQRRGKCNYILAATFTQKYIGTHLVSIMSSMIELIKLIFMSCWRICLELVIYSAEWRFLW